MVMEGNRMVVPGRPIAAKQLTMAGMRPFTRVASSP
jgi:hypothetical protein